MNSHGDNAPQPDFLSRQKVVNLMKKQTISQCVYINIISSYQKIVSWTLYYKSTSSRLSQNTKQAHI